MSKPNSFSEPGTSIDDGRRVFELVMDYHGKTRREVRSPNITARESIALANYISGIDQAVKGVLHAWDTTVLMKANDGMLQEKMEALRAALSQGGGA